MDGSLRRWIYANLGALFVDAPAPLDPPAPGDDEPETRQAIGALCQALRRASSDDLAAEQVRLFVNTRGGVPAPPYAGWYLDGALGGPSMVAVAEAYAAQCLEVATDGGQPADFIATELEFLHFLGRHQVAARATGDAEALAGALEAEAAFLVGHFTRWVPRFARAIRSAGPGPAFAAAADVLEAFCAGQARRLARPSSTASARLDGGAMDHLAHPVGSGRG